MLVRKVCHGSLAPCVYVQHYPSATHLLAHTYANRDRCRDEWQLNTQTLVITCCNRCYSIMGGCLGKKGSSKDIGALDQVEGIAGKIAPEKIKEWKAAFESFDADGNGKISRNEVLRFLMEKCGFSQSDATPVAEDIMSADTGGDGSLGWDEFKDRLVKEFMQKQ